MTMMKDNAAGRQTLVSSVLIELRKKTRSLPSLEMLTKFHPAGVFACTPEGGGELSRLYWAVTTSSSYLC